jgi:hypothetical protein
LDSDALNEIMDYTVIHRRRERIEASTRLIASSKAHLGLGAKAIELSNATTARWPRATNKRPIPWTQNARDSNLENHTLTTRRITGEHPT